MPKKLSCPACQKEVSPKGLAKHTNGCPEWDEKIGVSPKEFNFDSHFKRGLYEEGMEEGRDYVCCGLCNETGGDIRKKRLADHLKNIHGMTTKEYAEKFPQKRTKSEKFVSGRRDAVLEKYGVENVFQLDEVKKKSRETSLEHYGVGHAAQAEEVRERRAATNLEKFGCANPFGADEVKQKIKQHWRSLGVTCPAGTPEVQEKIQQTSRIKYGKDYYLQTDEFAEKAKKTSLERYNVEHPMKSEEVKEVLKETCLRKFGKAHHFLVPEIQEKSYQTNLKNHGGKHSQQCPEVLEKAKKTWLEKYGVDNPSKCEEIKKKIKEIWMGKYGVPFPPQSLWLNRKNSFPNKLEQKVDAMSSTNVVYTGDGSYWVSYKGAGKVRNPDFILLKASQVEAFQKGASLNDLRTSAVIEVFGDYWHGPKRVGKSQMEHQIEVEDYYKACGIKCLVLWETEINWEPKMSALRIISFVDSYLDLFED